MTLVRSSQVALAATASFRFRTLLRWISRMVETCLALQTTIQLPAPSPTCFDLDKSALRTTETIALVGRRHQTEQGVD
jgi:hypothetical protein